MESDRCGQSAQTAIVRYATQHHRSGIATAEHEERPHPGNSTDGNFKTGLPVDSHRWWILIDPAIHLGNSFMGVTLDTGKEVGFCQGDDVLMTIQLVNDFGIACAGVVHQIVVRPKAARPGFPRQRISMPIDDLSEIDFAKAQELDFMPANLLCIFDSLFDPFRESAANKIQAPLALNARRSKIEMRLGLPYEVVFEIIENPNGRHSVNSGVVAETLGLRTKPFLDAIHDLSRIHRCKS